MMIFKEQMLDHETHIQQLVMVLLLATLIWLVNDICRYCNYCSASGVGKHAIKEG